MIDFLATVWNDVKSGVETLWETGKKGVELVEEGTKTAYRWVADKDEPDPIAEFADMRETDKLAYFKILVNEYGYKLEDVKDELDPLRERLADVEARIQGLHDNKIRRLRAADEFQENLQNVQGRKRYHLKGSPMYNKFENGEKTLINQHQKGEQELSKESSVFQDDLLGHGQIEAKLYERLLKSKIEPLLKQEKYLSNQIEKARYWVEVTREERGEKLRK